MNNNKKLSIILPVYKVEKYIKRCLDSIYEQGVEESFFEVIVVDDESPDNSISIVKEYNIQHTNLTLITQKNKGLGGARNTGIINAKGEYIWFVDSDDSIKKNSIKILLKEIENNKPDIFSFDFDWIANKIHSRNGCCLEKTFCCTGSFYAVNHYSGQAWRNLYRVEYLKKNKFYFKERFLHEDGEFNMRVISYANTVVYVPFSLYNYYSDNSGSIMNSIKLKHIIDLLSYFDSAQDFTRAHTLNSEQKKGIMNCLTASTSLLFLESTSLSISDFAIYKKELNKYRKQLLKLSFSNLPNKMKCGIKIILCVCAPKIIPNWIYKKQI